MPAIPRHLTPRLAGAVVLLAGASASLAVNLPGHLEFDSIVQLLEGRTGVYSNWHPPVMAWMLGVGDAILPGAALFVIFDTVLAYGALLSLFWLTRRPSWRGVAAAAVAVCLPQLMLFQAIVWKDILFADACLGGFVCMAHAAAHWQRRRTRLALLSAAALLISLAMLTRQNGLLVLPCATAAIAVVAWRGEARAARGRAAVLVAASFFGACVGVGLVADAALQSRVVAPRAQAEMTAKAQVYDIVGMVQARPGLPLRVLDARAPHLAQLIRSGGPPLYTPATYDPLADWTELGSAIVRSETAVRDQWLALILHHPLDYLAVRARVFAWVALSRHPRACSIWRVGVDGPDEQMAALGLDPRMDARDTWLDAYASRFVGIAFLHPLFALIAAVCGALLVRRGRPADLVMVGLLGAAALYAASFFVISIACEYRYLYLVDLAALAALIHLLAGFQSRRS